MIDWRLLIRTTGGSEVIERETIETPVPGPGELRVRHYAVGVNYIDVYHRSGLYPLPLPTGLGSEAAGVVEAVGDGVTDLQPGDRVAYMAHVPGTYANVGIARADRTTKLPEAIGFDVAAAALLKGCTVEALLERCARVGPGMAILVHAAAGGVGSMMVPWAKSLGAFVIAHAGSSEKAARAKAAGADVALSDPFDVLADAVRNLTGGRGVDAAFDGVGAASWGASLASLAVRGLLVSYGNASGPVPPFTTLDLTRAGSVFVTRPTVFDYLRDPGSFGLSAKRVWDMIADGHVPIEIGQRFPLDAAAEAHRALEARKTTGATILEV
ncbi:quinone oxidoreductase [Sphingomonas sp. 1P06PA]|uniref:quinone oxidoreductase family protein n=1 Tax=Sphingomonas sp. 1P06PA TaxID=554121 RepID=UPI0039A5A4E2